MDRYKYEPIDLGGPAIRLIRLHRGSGSAQISCELFQAWLHEKELMPYEALSYTWGSAESPKHIVVNGKNLPVTRNLYDALEQLRYDDQDRILWIDAICINQDNNKERGHQVQQMGDIFKEADRVLFRLGEGTAATDMCLRYLSQLQQHSLRYPYRTWSRDDDGWEVIWSSAVYPRMGSSTPQVLETIRHGFRTILDQPWFRRVWILQEVTNAQTGLVCCGAKTVMPWLLGVAPRLLGVSPDDHCQAVLDVMLGPWKGSSWWSKSQDLWTLLANFGRSEATEPHDLIYALRGMSSDARNAPSLYPDYTKSEQQLVRDTLLCIFPIRAQQLDRLEPPPTIRQFVQHMKGLYKNICRLLHDELCGQGQKVLTKILSSYVRNEIFLLSLQYDHIGDVTNFQQAWEIESVINQSHLLAAAKNSRGAEPFKMMFGCIKGKTELTEELLVCAAMNGTCGDKIVEFILHYPRGQLLINENVMMAAAQNICCGSGIMEAILHDVRNHALLTIKILHTILSQSYPGMKILKTPKKIRASEDKWTKQLLCNAFQYWKMNPSTTASRIMTSRAQEYLLDTVLLPKAPGPYLRNAEGMLKLVVRFWRKLGISITPELLLAAVRNKTSGDRVLEILLAQMRDEIKIPRSLITLALSSKETKVLKLLIQYYPGRFSIPVYLQSIVATPGGDSSDLDAVVLQLKQQFRDPETPIDLVNVIWYTNINGIRMFLLNCNTKFVLTTSVLDAILVNRQREEIMSEMLCGNYPHISVGRGIALEIAKKCRFPYTESLLWHKHGIFFDENPDVPQLFASAKRGADRSIHDILEYALGNSLEQMVRLVFDHVNDMDRIFGLYHPSQMIAKATNSERGHQMVKLLASYGVDIEMKDECGDTTLMSVMRATKRFEYRFKEKMTPMSILLECGADVNTTNIMGETPLILAVQESLGHDIIKVLLIYGANLALRDELGLTAKDYALTKADRSTVELLERWQSGQHI